MIEKRTEIDVCGELEKGVIIDAVDQWRFDLGLELEEINAEKPWGAYWKIERRCVGQFLRLFFPERPVCMEDRKQDLSPKFLLVAPGERLSWQYHERRAEQWKVVAGEVEVKQSSTDDEIEAGKIYKQGDLINLKCGDRHRLIGRSDWGLVAEVWVHTDPTNLSDEEDIVRLADDYGRES